MNALEARKKDFDSLKAVAVAISVDSVPTKTAWAKELGIKDLRMLADFWPHGQVAKTYGVLREEDGLAQRSVFIVDDNGKIAFSKMYQLTELPDIDEVVGVLKKMNI
jgi:alkyl hydroperoxide reductase subunit AhpC